jgi:tryptophan 2,3-dioxygenase
MAERHDTPPLTYGSYLKVPELLRLQECRSSPEHPDELQFIIIHQAYELWFKLMLHELTGVGSAMDRDRPERAQHGMRRVCAIQRHLVQQIHILETMDPLDFSHFRDELRPASGFQSFQFRELEIVGGLRDESLLGIFEREPEALECLRRRLEEPSLPERFYRLLERSGLEMPRGDEGRVVRLRSLARIYEERESFGPLHSLAELLIEWDEWFRFWRSHHVLMVERTIGMKRGTGGSPGVGYLRTTLEAQFFPELLEVRTMLGSAEGGYGAPPSTPEESPA